MKTAEQIELRRCPWLILHFIGR